MTYSSFHVEATNLYMLEISFSYFEEQEVPMKIQDFNSIEQKDLQIFTKTESKEDPQVVQGEGK